MAIRIRYGKEQVVNYSPKLCVICGNTFKPATSRGLYCKIDCSRKAKRIKQNHFYQVNKTAIAIKMKKYAWKKNGHTKAQRLFKKMGIPRECQLCKSNYRTEIHHKDKNPNNNELTNLIMLCKQCHENTHHFK